MVVNYVLPVTCVVMCVCVYTVGMLYNRNRSERQVARKDVPLARVVQTEEEERQQKEAMQRMENLKKRSVVA